MTDKDRVSTFIKNATGKEWGRCTKLELAILFANTYTEYVKIHTQLMEGLGIYKAMKSQRDHYHKLIRNKDKEIKGMYEDDTLQ